ncbi:MAG TPA: hypothetical protein VNA30_08445 [Mycobacteriales bacterium]|nr:hypothetical protein [Mycobacteriales bacterium]
MTTTFQTVELNEQPVHRSFRLTRPGSVAMQSQVRPALVLPDRHARSLLAAAGRQDIAHGGCFSAGPAGIQLWSGPWDGVGGSRGSAEHLGSVDWGWDTPVRHYVTIYRVVVTAAGVSAGETSDSVLQRVIDLGGLALQGEQIGVAPPRPRDPFHGRTQLAG